ncbi:hypothetical protein, partial [Staphylococcus aureus]|uniref:hypothetical protein n=1 Tax=Staphylococcus aureus TaxID=1280 RepID=UPI00164305C5
GKKRKVEEKYNRLKEGIGGVSGDLGGLESGKSELENDIDQGRSRSGMRRGCIGGFNEKV